MPNTYIDYTAPVANYTFTFPYLDVSHVKVFVDDVAKVQGTHYTVSTNPTRVVFTAGNTPANGAIVRIRRVTFKDSALVDFVNGSTLLESDLDTAVRQTLYINQETTELNDTALQIGAGTSDFYAQDKKITHLATPTQANEATNKSYVDSTTVSVTGDTMTGPLAMSNNKITGLGTPTAASDASTKDYVDTTDTLKLNKAGDTMSGNLAMGGNRVTGLAEPVLAQDAATLASVNQAVSNAVIFGTTNPPSVFSFVGNGNSQFTLEVSGPSSILTSSSYLVSIDGVVQKPDTDFSIILATTNLDILFSEPPPTGSSIVVQCVGFKVPVGDSQIPPLSITAGKLAADSVTSVKILNGEITSNKLASTIDFTGKTVNGLTKSTVGLANVQNLDQTNADNISSGTLNADRLPNSPVLSRAINPRFVETFSIDNKGRIVSVTNSTGSRWQNAYAVLSLGAVSGWGRQTAPITQYSTYGTWQQIGASNGWSVVTNNGASSSNGFVTTGGFSSGTYIAPATGTYKITLQGLILGAGSGYCQLGLGATTANVAFYSYQNFLGYQFHTLVGFFGMFGGSSSISPFMFISGGSWFTHTSAYTTMFVERLD